MRALVLSGGGFRGAVQVPIINHLTSCYKYDSIYGVSVGALNGIMVAQEKIQTLWDIWRSIDGIGDFLKLKWYSPWNGLYSMRPLRKLIEKHTSLKEIKTPFYAGLVSLNNRKYYNLCSTEMTTDKQLWNAIEGSSCIVGLMVPPKIEIGGSTHIAVDGGFRNIIPIPSHTRYEHIDIVACVPLKRLDKEQRKFSNIFNTIPRGIEIMQDEILKRDYGEIFTKALARASSLTIYAPKREPGATFEASKEIIAKRFELGYEALKNPIYIRGKN